MSIFCVSFFTLVVGFSTFAKESGAKLDFYSTVKDNHSKAVQPPIVQLIEPRALSRVDGSTVELRWAPVEGIQIYHVQVATDANFKWYMKDTAGKTLDLINYTDTKLKLTNLEPGKHYFWRVAARKPDNDPSYTKGYFVMSSFETSDGSATAQTASTEKPEKTAVVQ